MLLTSSAIRLQNNKHLCENILPGSRKIGLFSYAQFEVYKKNE